jgi:thiol-disulfide isomerase/thioredoxin
VAETAGAPLIGKYAPTLKVRTLDGKTIDPAKLYGKKPVYIKFWATWCVPCRLQMPHFENVEKTLGKDIQVIALDANFNETRQAVVDYRKKMGLTMPIAIDDGRMADALNLRVTPQHIVIGRDGRILQVGHLVDAKLDNALKQAIAEKPAAYAPGEGVKGAGPSAPVLKTLSGRPLALSDGAKAGSNKDLAHYQREHNLTLPLALDETGGFFRAYNIADVPTFVVLDKAGRVIGRARRRKRPAASPSRRANPQPRCPRCARSTSPPLSPPSPWPCLPTPKRGRPPPRRRARPPPRCSPPTFRTCRASSWWS